METQKKVERRALSYSLELVDFDGVLLKSPTEMWLRKFGKQETIEMLVRVHRYEHICILCFKMGNF